MAILATIGVIDTGSITFNRWGWLTTLSCPGGAEGCDDGPGLQVDRGHGVMVGGAVGDVRAPTGEKLLPHERNPGSCVDANSEGSGSRG